MTYGINAALFSLFPFHFSLFLLFSSPERLIHNWGFLVKTPYKYWKQASGDLAREK
jgi:hypothetical protein